MFFCDLNSYINQYQVIRACELWPNPPPQKQPFYYTIFFYDIAQLRKKCFRAFAHYFGFTRVGFGRFRNFSIFGLACGARTKCRNWGFCPFLGVFLLKNHRKWSKCTLFFGRKMTLNRVISVWFRVF